MRIVSLKRKTIPKVAVLVMGLTAAVLVATINPAPADATPRAGNCAGCHASDTGNVATVTAIPSTATPAAGATYTVAITMSANPNGGNTGFGIQAVVPTPAPNPVVRGGPSASLSYTATMIAPTAAGTYSYTVYTNQGMDDPTVSLTGSKVFSITVAGAPSVVTTTTALAVTPVSPVVAPASPTLKATVTGTGAAGTVEFFNGTTSLGAATAISAGVASKTLTGIAVGSYAYTAKFVPTNATAFTPSTSSVSTYVVTVPAPVVVTTSTALAVTPASPVVAPGSPTLKATVAGSGAAGTVEFFNGTTSLGAATAISAGVASKTLTGIAVGSYAYTAKFVPTNATAFTPSTSSVSAYVVSAAPVPAPTASFTASAISGVAPLAVTLTDTSTGAPTSWLWTFGNGSTSNVQNPPAVTYTTAGTYTVTLIASNANGASAPVTTTITVTAAPVVVVPVSSFTSAVSATDPLTVAMTDTSSETPTSWAWNLGNGTTSTLQSPSVSYAAAGTYTVTLTATNADGAGNMATKDITVTATPGTSTAHISRLSTDEGHVGSWVAITGTGFGPTAGTVKFGTVTATVMFWTDKAIGVKVPAGISDDEVDVTVIPVGGTASNGVEFEVEGDGNGGHHGDAYGHHGDAYGHDGDRSDDSPRHYVRLGGYFD